MGVCGSLKMAVGMQILDSAVDLAQSQYLEPHKAFVSYSMQGKANCVWLYGPWELIAKS